MISGKTTIMMAVCSTKKPGWSEANALLGVLFAVFALLLLVPCLAGSQEARPIGLTMERLAMELAQRFPRVAGEVLKVDGEQIYVSLGVRDHLLAGVLLSLFREGEPLKHPSTGETLGRVEEELGTVAVVQVAERYAIARRLGSEDTRTVQPGDHVRITSGPVALGVLPVTGAIPADTSSEALDVQLQRALASTDRFRLEASDRVRIWWLERGLTADEAMTPASLSELALALQVVYVLKPQVRDLQGRAVFELQLLLPTRPQPVTTASALLPTTTAARQLPLPSVLEPPSAPPASVPPPQSAPVQAAPAVPAEQRLGGLFQEPLQRSPGDVAWNLADTMTEIRHFPYLLLGADAADIDGDGVPEIMLVSNNSVSLYRLLGEILEPIDTYAAGPQGTFISAQLMRLGSDIGIAVNHQRSAEGMDSFILRLDGRQLVPWQEHFNETLLAVDSDGDGIKESLWGQPVDENKLFLRGTVRRYVAVNGTLEHQDNLRVPTAFRATGAALLQLGAKASRELVFIDADNRLRIYRESRKVWESPTYVGGSYAYAELQQAIPSDFRVGDVLKEFFYFEPIPVAIDIDHDGIEEALVIRNVTDFVGKLVPNRSRYRSGDVALLRVGRYGYTLSPISPKFDGMVSGLAVTGGGTPGVLIVVSKVTGTLGQYKETWLFLSRLPVS